MTGILKNLVEENILSRNNGKAKTSLNKVLQRMAGLALFQRLSLCPLDSYHFASWSKKTNNNCKIEKKDCYGISEEKISSLDLRKPRPVGGGIKIFA